MIHYKSINQHNASLEEQEDYYRTLKMNFNQPSVFLQTCNRIELYYGDGTVPNTVANHLFRVVSGLESALIGERAVQGQVKEAYAVARSKYKLPASMNKLFEYALFVGKRVRNETEISHGAVSHSLATIEILEEEGIDLSNARITIIGVNKLTEDILKFLKNKGAKMIFLANRSEAKARLLATPLQIDVFNLENKNAFLQQTDILISATSAPHFIINKGDLPSRKSMLIIDLAFPRDIDPTVVECNGIKLYNIRDIEKKVQRNILIREGEMDRAEQIIREEIEALQKTLSRRNAYLMAYS